MKRKTIITTILICSIILLLVGCGGKSTAEKLAQYGEEQFLKNDFQNYLEGVRNCGLSDLTAEVSLSYNYKYDFNKNAKELIVECNLVNVKSDIIDEYYTAKNNKTDAKELANIMLQTYNQAFPGRPDNIYTYESQSGKVIVEITDGFSDGINIKTSQGRNYKYLGMSSFDTVDIDGQQVYFEKKVEEAEEDKGNSKSYSYNSTTNVTDDDELGTCWALAKDVVKSNLKSPSSAKFPFSYGSDGVSITKSGNTYTVQAWVDAENSFGANIRSNFIVTMEKSGSGKNAKFTSKSCIIE